jgi:hypothetical protein
VRRGNTGRKLTNKAADDQFGSAKSGFLAASEYGMILLNNSVFYIHGVEYICQGTNAEFVIYIIFILPFFFDQLVYDDRKT